MVLIFFPLLCTVYSIIWFFIFWVLWLIFSILNIVYDGNVTISSFYFSSMSNKSMNYSHIHVSIWYVTPYSDHIIFWTSSNALNFPMDFVCAWCIFCTNKIPQRHCTNCDGTNIHVKFIIWDLHDGSSIAIPYREYVCIYIYILRMIQTSPPALLHK